MVHQALEALEALRTGGIQFESEHDSQEKITRANPITPMAVHVFMKVHQKAPEAPAVNITAEEIVARYSGTGLCRKTLAEMCATTGVDLKQGLDELARAGVEATADDDADELAEKHELNPIDLLKIMMLP